MLRRVASARRRAERGARIGWRQTEVEGASAGFAASAGGGASAGFAAVSPLLIEGAREARRGEKEGSRPHLRDVRTGGHLLIRVMEWV